MDGHIRQHSAVGTVDHQRTRYIPVHLLVGLDQRVDHVAEDVDDLRPGNRVCGAEIAVADVIEIAPCCHLRYGGTGVLGDPVRVGVRQVRRLRLNTERAGYHGYRLLAGNGVPRQGLAVVAQVYPGGVEFQNSLLPVDPRRVREGLRPGDRLKLQKAVHDTGESAPGDGGVRAERTVLVTLDDMVLLAPLLDAVLGPVALCIGKRHGGNNGQSSPQRGGGQPFEKSGMMHDGSFLSVFVGEFFKKTPQPVWAAVLCHLCNSACCHYTKWKCWGQDPRKVFHGNIMSP